MDYIILKWVHIISATILFGTGIGSAFYMFMANRSKITSDIYFATKNVVIADWLFTTPAIITQLFTGIWLMHITGHAYSSTWIVWAFALYLFAGVCWLPVVWLQIQMRNIARNSVEQNKPLPPRYWKMDRWWIFLGSLAFPAVTVIFYLMVARPE